MSLLYKNEGKLYIMSFLPFPNLGPVEIFLLTWASIPAYDRIAFAVFVFCGRVSRIPGWLHTLFVTEDEPLPLRPEN